MAWAKLKLAASVAVLLLATAGLSISVAQVAAPGDGETADLNTPRPAATRPAPTTRIGTMRMAPGTAPTAMGQGPACTFDATIYEVRLPPEQIGRIDATALTAAAGTAETFEKALEGLGPFKPLYRVNQSVRLSGDLVSTNMQVPLTTGVRKTDTGQMIRTVSYQQVGASFKIIGNARTGGGLDVDLGIELAALNDASVDIAPDLGAPTIRKAVMAHKGPVGSDKPFVTFSADAASLDAAGKAVAYVARISLGPAQGGHGSAAGQPAALRNVPGN